MILKKIRQRMRAFYNKKSLIAFTGTALLISAYGFRLVKEKDSDYR
jgi:hypothetical protein